MDALKQHPISLHEVYLARKVVKQHVPPSPLTYYESLSQLLGCEAYVKHENQNITGSFKIRGGINLMSHVKHAGVSGVVTFSTGNHGLSVAKSAKLLGIPAIVVVPEGANPRKIALIQAAGLKWWKRVKTLMRARKWWSRSVSRKAITSFIRPMSRI
ncbi:threonine dehydratase [Photobacterium aphoticum]|uniref:Threonine dehydratase n=1 Tax=Photobacterium aphoticum TaxID=754436 RepID=A0A090R8V8_9GAMM|nr:threonine dehydratase [Photobacterium aphoticum]